MAQVTRNFAVKHQRGSVLIISLILLVAATVLTLTSVQSSIMHERMTANSYSKEAARLAAEAGAFRAREWINDLTLNEWNNWKANPAQALPWHTDPISVINDKKGIPLSSVAVPFMNDNSIFWIDPTELDFSNPEFAVIRVMGGVKPAVDAELQAVATISLRVSPPQSESSMDQAPFDKGLIGCEGIHINGGGRIDSFNSDLAGYGADFFDSDGTILQNSLRSNVTIGTIADGATATLDGGAQVYGSLAITGDLNIHNYTVHGNVHADGNVNADGNVKGDLAAVGNVTIGGASTQEGSVQSGGSVDVFGRLYGDLAAQGDIVFSGSSQAAGVDVQSGGNVAMTWNGNPPASVTAAGVINSPMAKPSSYVENAQVSDVTVAPILDPSDVCDSIGLVDETGNPGQRFNDAWNHPDMKELTQDYFNPAAQNPYEQFGIQPVHNGMELFGSGKAPTNEFTVGETGADTFLRVDTNLMASGTLSAINIEGNVTLVVDGNFNLGGSTQLNISNDATLTLLITGQTSLSAGTNLSSTGPFVRGDGESATPAVQIFSTYNSDGNAQPGVEVGGSNNAHIAVYAPYSAVNLVGSGDIFGSVRSRFLNVSGGGAIHFDEALARVKGGSGRDDGEPIAASVISWFETVH